jgi:ATP-dependent DNA helicase 2 subunit 2
VSKENEHILKKGAAASQNYLKDEDIKLESANGDVERNFKLLGFTDQDKVPRAHFLNGVDVVLPVKSEKNERAFAALVYAMIETHRVIMAKIIERKNADAKLVVLYPHISKKKPILYMVQLPTAEDIRDYQFPSLVASTNP